MNTKWIHTNWIHLSKLNKLNGTNEIIEYEMNAWNTEYNNDYNLTLSALSANWFYSFKCGPLINKWNLFILVKAVAAGNC